MTEIITTDTTDTTASTTDNGDHVEVRPVNSYRSRPLYRSVQIVWYVLDLVEVLLLFRFILKLLAANPYAGFSRFIYGVTYPLAVPFLNVFRITRVIGATFEWPTLLAMLVYWLLAWAIVRLIVMGKPMSVTEAEYKLNNEEQRTK